MSMHFAVMTKTTLWSFLPQVQSADFVCSECGKKYKTRGGYQRHRASKHNPNENDRQERTTLTPSSLAEIVKYAIQTVNRGRAFAPMVRGSTSCNFFFFFARILSWLWVLRIWFLVCLFVCFLLYVEALRTNHGIFATHELTVERSPRIALVQENMNSLYCLLRNDKDDTEYELFSFLRDMR